MPFVQWTGAGMSINLRRFIDAKAHRYVIISKDAEIGAIFGTRVPDFADSRFVVFRLP